MQTKIMNKESALKNELTRINSINTEDSIKNIVIPSLNSINEHSLSNKNLNRNDKINTEDKNQTFLLKRNHSIFNFELLKKPKLMDNSFLLIGNLKYILERFNFKTDCNIPNQCSLLNKITCCFFKIWSFGISNWSKEYIPFSEHMNYTSLNIKELKEIILNLSSQEDPDELMMTDLISLFITNPTEYLNKYQFTDLSWRERVVALFYLVKRQALLIPPKCFCTDIFKVHVKKDSSKRKHEAVRFFIKRYMLYIMEKTLPQYYILKPIPERKKDFYKIMGENGSPIGSQDLMKFFFNEIVRDNLKGQRTKSLVQLFSILKENPITKDFFEKKSLLSNYNEICHEYNRERIIKVERFLIQFRGKSFLEILKTILELLKNKRFKLFFTEKDMDVGMHYVSTMI